MKALDIVHLMDRSLVRTSLNWVIHGVEQVWVNWIDVTPHLDALRLTPSYEAEVF